MVAPSFVQSIGGSIGRGAMTQLVVLPKTLAHKTITRESAYPLVKKVFVFDQNFFTSFPLRRAESPRP